MPWDPRFRKPDVAGVTARAIEVVVETGDSGPLTAGRHQPAERSGHPRKVRQQVGLAGQRERGVRALDARGDAGRILVERGRGRPREDVGRASRRSSRRTCTK